MYWALCYAFTYIITTEWHTGGRAGKNQTDTEIIIHRRLVAACGLNPIGQLTANMKLSTFSTGFK